jgi:hypothetical protein
MSANNRGNCLSSAKRPHLAAAAVTLALVLGHSSLAQLAGTVETLGGTGEAGYAEGITGFSAFRNPSALAIRGDGKVFIADTDNNAVRQLRIADNATSTFASANRPVGLAFDTSTNLFVANQGDNTITKFDYFANFRQTLHPQLGAGLMTAMTIDRANKLYVAQQSGTISRINLDGVVEATFRVPGAGPHDVHGVAITDTGVLFVSDAAEHVIYRFTGTEVDVFAGTLNRPGSAQGELGFGQFNRPHQVAIGPNGSVVVADRGNHQVRVVSCSGIITRLYGTDLPWFEAPSPEVFPGWYDGSAEFAELREPVGLAVDKGGTVYDTEVYYHLVRAASGVQFPLGCNGGGPDPTPDSTNTPPRLVISPNTGFYPRGITITITASNSTAGFSRETTIFYTTNGLVPTTGDTQVQIGDNGRASFTLAGPIDLAGLRVRAFFGEKGGDVTAALPTQVPLPVLSPDSGYYPMGMDIVVTSSTGNAFPEGTILYFEKEGETPSTNSPVANIENGRAVIGWGDATRDLRSLKIRAHLGPNEGQVVSGHAVSFPNEPEIQGEVGIPPARNGFKAGIASLYILPVVANLRNDQKLQSLQFVVELTALPGSPRLEREDLTILPMSTNDFIQIMPASTVPPSNPIQTARDGVNRLGISYIGTNSGFNVTAGYATVALLAIQFRAIDSQGTTAEVGDGYTIRVINVSGSSPGVLLPLKAMPERTIRFENIRYREGDTFPAYWYNAGDFGNGVLDNRDVNNAVFAGFDFYRPFPLTDAFAAMDVYRLGLDGNVIGYVDGASILRRALGFESSDLFRVRNDAGEWESSRSAGRVLARNSTRALSSETQAWRRDVTIVGGVIDRVDVIQSVWVPVYMKAGAGVKVAGMQFVADVVPVGGAPEVSSVTFLPSASLPAPSWQGSALPTTAYARWDNLPTGLSGTLLLGYIQFITPAILPAGSHYNVNFRETGGAASDPETGALTGYLFESIHGEVWPWVSAPAKPEVSDDWKVHFFQTLTAPEDEDADNDGFTNVEEYLTGSDPTQADWQVRSVDGHLSFRWVARSGKSYSVEKTEDFKTWSAVTEPIPGRDAFLEYSELTSPAKAQFYRLNVQ